MPSVLKIPVSTYRLQFSYIFGFSKAKRIISYLHAIGITDIYASPYFKARKASLHGYDVVDPTSLNPEVGTVEEYESLVLEIRKHGMGQLLDIVPNHMCNESENPWWMDVLENGPSSQYAPFFDIDWTPAVSKLTDKILIPLLGEHYGKALESQELKLSFEGGAFFVRYYDNRFPVLPDSYVAILENGIEEFRDVFPVDDPHVVELLSIITALKHLPPPTEKEDEKKGERHREKEIIKKRLLALYSESNEIRDFVDKNVGIFNGVKGDPKSFNLLDGLLAVQVWRLSYWRVAMEEINYRRFFDINNISAVHVEDPRVFDETHRLVFELVSEGKVTGLRVDHSDGLYNAGEYFDRLQQRCSPDSDARRLSLFTDEEGRSPRPSPGAIETVPDTLPFYIVAEKILMRGERLPEGWPVFGTTGYVFMNSLNGIFVETKNAKAFDNLYSAFIRDRMDFQELAYEKKKLVMQVSMSGEISTLGHYLNIISERNRHTRDFTLNSLTRAIIEVIALFPVYRTYINSGTVNDRDRQYIEVSLSKARRRNPAISSSVFDFIRDVLLLRFPEDIAEEDKRAWLDFVMRFQQITPPVTAKGIEDTAFYVYNRLVSLNEVGGGPERFGAPLEAFHGQNIERLKNQPHGLTATSTHDTKRSEDVRARINVLSEIPEKWRKCIARWSLLNRKKKASLDGQAVPDRNEEYLLYQSLVGAWPNGSMSDADFGVFRKRVQEYMIKAIREAKVNTSWISPNGPYEDAMTAFIGEVLADDLFLAEFRSFRIMVSHCGSFNSLSQTLLKITSPGVPDFYQGSDLWDFSLVDPDNRRAVDYGVRIRMLEELKRMESGTGQTEFIRILLNEKDNGQIKLYLMYKALNFRKENADLFGNGEYLPLEGAGEKANHVCAFARRHDTSLVLSVVPRFITGLIDEPDELPLGEKIWGECYIPVPFEKVGTAFRNLFTGETLTTSEREGAAVLYLRDILSGFPVALMIKEQGVGSRV